MPRTLSLIAPEMLEPSFLTEFIYPDPRYTLYATPSWSPSFYVDLARAGFISVAYLHPNHGPLLLPELQESYAMLDWDDLHCSRNLRRLIRSEILDNEDVEFRIDASVDRVLARIHEQHGDRWIIEPYAALMRQLATGCDPRITLHGVELWSRSRDELVAGELGYTVGATYTSLSGFCATRERALRHFGSLQMLLLATILRERGYAFWNLGHPTQPYKKAMGARIVPRAEFLDRWLDARDGELESALNGTRGIGAGDERIQRWR